MIPEHLQNLKDIHFLTSPKAQLLFEETSPLLLLEDLASTSRVSYHLFIYLLLAVGVIDLLSIESFLSDSLSINQIALLEDLPLTVITAIKEVSRPTHVPEPLLEVVSCLLER